jgi:hypothetical protein
MSQSYDNTNTGIIRGNPGIIDNNKRPIVKGSINIEGEEYWLSGWVPNLEGKVSAEDAQYIQEFFMYIATELDLPCLLRFKLEPKEAMKKTSKNISDQAPSAVKGSRLAIAAPVVEEQDTTDKW